ncbi:filamentous hemagglutinin domain protein [Bordetella bronchiseptica 00-P-2730]|nr:filamentous hemagglutinin domain protein [Bordetella bronchiseptica 00-P-2730]
MIDGQKVLAPRLYLTEATRQGITDQYAGGGALIASGGDVTSIRTAMTSVRSTG